jgi:acyl-CoA thioesterase
MKPYWRLLGVGAEEIGDGYARLRMPLAAELRNSDTGGSAHGGALASLVDMAVGTALDSLDLPDVATRATIELSVTYLEAAEGEAIIAEGRMLRVGRSVAAGEAELRDGDGRLVAKGRATYMIRRRPASQP